MTATSRTRTGKSEWVGGGATLSQYVVGEGDAPFKPETFVWLDGNGLVVGTTLFRPGEATSQIGAFFRDTTRAPVVGPPRVPSRVRVASPELAEALRREIGAETEVVCAATPEVDDVLASLNEHLGTSGDDDAVTYLTAGLTVAALARFFRAVASLYRVRPWKVLPSDDGLVGVSIAELGVRGARLSVTGQLGATYGLVLFPNDESFARFLDVTATLMAGGKEKPPLPPHVFLELVARHDLEPALADEIAEHRWEIAGPRAYPSVSAIDDEGIPRPVTARELAALEAIALAVVELLATEELCSQTFPVETSLGLVHVALSVDDDEDDDDEWRNPYAESFDIHADLSDGDERDIGAWEEELVDRFARSSEASDLDDGAAFWAGRLLDLARTYHGPTVTELKPSIVEEVVFVDLPRKVSCDADSAPEIVAALRAFLAYLGREHGLADVARCTSVLGAGAEAKLRKRLSDPRNFGMAKSFLMGAKAAGFDPTTEDGAAAWMNAMMNGKGALSTLVARPQLPPPGPRPSAETSAKKKAKRKAQRAGRRKTRR